MRKSIGYAVIAMSIALLGWSLLETTAVAAASWWHEAPLKVKAHDHQFYRVTANAIGCEVRVRLHLDAPAERYRDSEPSLNHYRFVAQLKMSGGDKFVSKVLNNRQPGPRVFSFTHDSQLDGCWAQQPKRIRKVNIHSCHGPRCKPRGFN